MPGVFLIRASFFNSHILIPTSSNHLVAFLMISLHTRGSIIVFFFFYTVHLMRAYDAPSTMKLLRALTPTSPNFSPCLGSACLFHTFGGHIRLAPWGSLPPTSKASPAMRLRRVPNCFVTEPPNFHHTSACLLAWCLALWKKAP